MEKTSLARWKIVCFLSMLSLSHCSDAVSILLGVFLSESPSRFEQALFLPAIEVAIEKVNHDWGLNISYQVRLSLSDCSDILPVYSPKLSAELYHVFKVDGFLGHPCSYETIGVSDLASAWNLPVISGASTSSILDNKIRFPTLTRTSFKTQSLSRFCASFFNHFRWKTSGMIVAKFGFNTIVAGALETAFINSGIDVLRHNHFEFESTEELLKVVISTSRSK